jgi:lipopolysaccharide transport system ATP-binding protein
VTEFIDTPVKRYSSGMYLRLAFAVAAHLETEILLVDEVLAVGDVQFQKKCMGKIEQVAGQGRTVLFVSHNMPAVQRLCTRGILLSGGTIVHDGNVRPVIQEYLTLDLGQAGERTWPDNESAPGDSVARMRAVRALNLSGEVSSEFSVRDDWYLEVEFAVLSAGYPINVNIFLYDESGILIFAAGDYQLEEWHERNREVGVYRSRCRVPKDLLNDGTIRVLAGIYSPPSTLRGIERDAISVRINEDLSTSGARGFYPGPWPGGAVRPSLDWECEFTPRSNQL